MCSVVEMREKKSSKICCKTWVLLIGNGLLLFLVTKIVEAQVQHKKKI